MRANFRARAAKYGYRTDEVTVAMLNMELSFDTLQEFDADNKRQTYDARCDDCINHDSAVQCVPVCPRCRQADHMIADCRKLCWACMIEHGHADDCEVAAVSAETILIPATEARR